MGWVSPTGFVDEDTVWNNEGNAYDENTGTFTHQAMVPDSERWSSFIELTHAALDCDKVRFWCLYDGTNRKNVDVDVYYGDTWVDVYEGVVASGEFVEKDVLAGEQSITALRFRQTVGAGVGLNIILYEADFWEEPVPTPVTDGDLIGIGIIRKS